MKKVLGLFLTAALFAGVFTACGPTETTTPELKLTADNDVVAVGEKVTFTVKLGDKDVTADSQICDPDGMCLMGNEWTPAETKEYSFYASYGDLKSDYIYVDVTGPAFDASKDIHKNVAFFTWTATWCGPCYGYKTYMKNVLKTLSDNIVQVNLHTAYVANQPDDIHNPKKSGLEPHASLNNVDNQLKVEGRFKIGGWPTSIADLRKDLVDGKPLVPTEANIRSAYTAYIGNAPKTGVSVNSNITDKISASVTVGAKEAGEYYIGAFLVEDHITASQNGGGSKYDHTNVARQMGVSNLFGDSLGAMTAGQTVNKEFTFDLDSKYKTENLFIVCRTDQLFCRGDTRICAGFGRRGKVFTENPTQTHSPQ